MTLQNYRSLALVLAVLAATVGCQSGRKQTFLPPPQAQAPAIKPAPKAAAPVPAALPASTAVAPAPKPQATPQPSQPPPVDPVAELIGRVEREYHAGLDSYNANNLEAAKKS